MALVFWLIVGPLLVFIAFWWWFWLIYMLPSDHKKRLERRKKWMGY